MVSQLCERGVQLKACCQNFVVVQLERLSPEEDYAERNVLKLARSKAVDHLWYLVTPPTKHISEEAHKRNGALDSQADPGKPITQGL